MLLLLYVTAGFSAIVMSHRLVTAVALLVAWLWRPHDSVPGPWYTAVSPAWFFWQRWHGRLTKRADNLLGLHGDDGIVRVHPNIVLVSDPSVIRTLFFRKDVQIGSDEVRALHIGGQDWTITTTSFEEVRPPRAIVRRLTSLSSLKHWQPAIEANIASMVKDVRRLSQEGDSTWPVDAIPLLDRLTVRTGGLVLSGTWISDEEAAHASDAMRNFGNLVSLRVCLPRWLNHLLDMLPVSLVSWSPRLASSRQLLEIGRTLARQEGQASHAGQLHGADKAATSSQTFLHALRESDGKHSLNEEQCHVELAGALLASSDTTSSALIFLLYEISRRPKLQQRLFGEIHTFSSSTAGKESLLLQDGTLLAACVDECLRLCGPVALVSSIIVPPEGATVPGKRGDRHYWLPGGTVVMVQNYSVSRGLLSDVDRENFDLERWLAATPQRQLDQRQLEGGGGGVVGANDNGGRRQLSYPFGFGLRRCPGRAMAVFQLRLVLARLVQAFIIECPPETTAESMAPTEINGFRPSGDRCLLLFRPREEEHSRAN